MIRKPVVPAPAEPRQTFGDRMAAKMAAQTPPPSQRASQNMAPGTGGRGTQQEYAARMQQQAMPAGVAQYGAQMQPSSESFDEYMARINADKEKQRLLKLKYPDSFPYNITEDLRKGLDMGPKPPVAGGGLPNAAKVGMLKKGGAVRYAGGGKTEEKKDPPIPKATQESMKLQAAQEKADRKQAEEQKAGEKEVRDNMGRIGFKNGGSIKASKMGAVKTGKPKMGSASSRADGCAQRGKTRGKMV